VKRHVSEEIQSFVHQMITAVSTATLYSPEHQQLDRLCNAAAASLRTALGDRQDISMVVIDNELIVDGNPLGQSLHHGKFIRLLSSRGIGHIRIHNEVDSNEIKSLVTSLASRNMATEICSTDNIRLGKVEVRFSDASGKGEGTCGTFISEGESAETIARYREFCESIRKHKKLKVAGVVDIVSGFIDAVRSTSFPLLALAPLRASDEYTFTHSTNICILNLAQSMAMGLEGPVLQDIGVAALLHDVGKYFVPEEVLNKPGRLDESEWNLMMQHPVKGALYLLETPGVPHVAVLTAYEHHMKYDQTGYPSVIGGWQQNLCSHMTAVSDIFDALRTKRPYRAALEMDVILGKLLEMAGTELHPVVTRNFLKVLKALSNEQQD
jgi:HD-GYP domain-containing protein (c-di-GMP phosphodiesterase class II)